MQEENTTTNKASVEEVMELLEQEKRQQLENIYNETLHNLEKDEIRNVHRAEDVYVVQEEIFERFREYLAEYHGFDADGMRIPACA